MDDTYARSYRVLYERHWWWRAREELLLSEIGRLDRQRPIRSVLDVGCGDGLFFDALSTFGTVEGVEPLGHLIPTDAPYRDRIHVGPFDDTYAPRKRFDLILMLDVLEHLDDPAAALRHGLQLLEPGGRLLVTVPAFNLLWTRHDDLNDHVTRYTKASFSTLARESSYEIWEARYFFHWLFLGKLLVRMLERVSRRLPSSSALPWAPLNAALVALCRVEHALTRYLPVPFGSSLLVVGGRSGRVD